MGFWEEAFDCILMLDIITVGGCLSQGCRYGEWENEFF